ncbi:MAG: putative ABC transporter permease, partial [Christensenellaceae bacterium]
TVEERRKNHQAEDYGHGIVSIVAKYVLLYLFISFLGWLWEEIYVCFVYGRFTDRGFLTMPFCPIYGTAVFFVYFLLGTPQSGRGILKNTQSALARNLIYLLFAFVIPTATELAVGIFFDKALGVTLWTYSDMPLNLGGYVCLPVSLVWTAAVYVFMRFAFLPMKRLVFRLPSGFAVLLAAVFVVILGADGLMNLFALWR